MRKLGLGLVVLIITWAISMISGCESPTRVHKATDTPIRVHKATDTPIVPPPVPARIDFRADKTRIPAGECSVLSWRVDNVREVYLDGKRVQEYGSLLVCPEDDVIYTLSVVHLDGTVEQRQVTIQVLPQPTLTVTNTPTLIPPTYMPLPTETPELIVTSEPPPDGLPVTGIVAEQLLEAGWWIVLFGLAFLLAISGFLQSGSRKR